MTPATPQKWKIDEFRSLDIQLLVHQVKKRTTLGEKEAWEDSPVKRVKSDVRHSDALQFDGLDVIDSESSSSGKFDV